jgi:hypothetical protein
MPSEPPVTNATLTCERVNFHRIGRVCCLAHRRTMDDSLILPLSEVEAIPLLCELLRTDG